MVKLFRAELTATGRPVLLHGEVERLMLDRVSGGMRISAAVFCRCFAELKANLVLPSVVED